MNDGAAAAKPLRVLIVDDVEDDALLTIRELARSGYRPQYVRVADRDSLKAALGEGGWDLVVVDYNMPKLTCREAVDSVKKADAEAPLIVVSGTVGEERAVELLKWGVSDLVLKQNLGRLAPVVRRELEASRARRLQLRAEAALKESESLFRELAENLGAVLWVTDPATARTLYVNPAYETVWGRSRQSLYADPLSFIDGIHPEDRSRVGAAMRQRARGGYDERYRVLRPDGTLRWIRDRAFPVRDDNGGVRRTVGIVENVTDLVEAIQENALLASILENLPDAVEVVGADGRTEYVNPAHARTTGHAAEDCLGKTPAELHGPIADDPGFHDRIGGALGDGQVWHGQFGLVRKDGAPWDVEATVFPVKGQTGATLHRVAIMRDATERRRLEAELLQAQKMEALGQFTGGIAHDFNNLLTVVLGNLELLLMWLPPNDGRLRDRASQARHAAQRGAKLVERLMAFGRWQVAEPEAININEVVASLGEILGRILGEHIEIDARLAEDVGTVVVEPGQFEAAFLNLAVNARDAMPQGGYLVIRTANLEVKDADSSGHGSVPPGRYATLAVSDDGTGMTAEVKRRAFEPFFTTKGIGKGTGLGLSMVYGFAQKSGGGVHVDSEPGRGTTVTLFLPVGGAPRP